MSRSAKGDHLFDLTISKQIFLFLNFLSGSWQIDSTKDMARTHPQLENKKNVSQNSEVK